ncbi:MAG TPA: hypothetical protein VM165_15325 [Planctomycetaceae bacterium]|nr:hypothetical protein [Planctomycetaceae bacterium]
MLVCKFDVGVARCRQNGRRMPGQLLSRGQWHAMTSQIRDVRVSQGMEIGKQSVRVLVVDPGRLQINLQHFARASVLGPRTQPKQFVGLPSEQPVADRCQNLRRNWQHILATAL